MAFLLAIKASGKDHWERHLTGDELIHVLDDSATLERCATMARPKSFSLNAGMIAVIPQGAWHRFLSPEGNAHLAATPFPGETIKLDVDDPRGGASIRCRALTAAAGAELPMQQAYPDAASESDLVLDRRRPRPPAASGTIYDRVSP